MTIENYPILSIKLITPCRWPVTDTIGMRGDIHRRDYPSSPGLFYHCRVEDRQLLVECQPHFVTLVANRNPNADRIGR